MKKLQALALVCALAAASMAQATIIDFNANGAQDYFVSSVVSNGFVATPAPAGDHNLGTSNDFDFANFAINDTIYLTSWSNSFNTTSVTLVDQAAALFSLQGFDFDNAYATGSDSRTDSVTVVGTHADNTTVTQVFDNLHNVERWTSFLTSGFDNLSSVTFTSVGDPEVRALYDNIIVNQPAAPAVPEPASLALVGLALAGLAASRRKRA